LTFDLLTSGSVFAEVLPCTRARSNKQKDKQTDRREWMPCPTQAAIQVSWVIIIIKYMHKVRHLKLAICI